MPKFFDIHSHLNFDEYKTDFKSVLGRMRETGTYTIVVGTDFDSSAKAVDLADRYEEIYACIGVHPATLKAGFNWSKKSDFDEKAFAQLAVHPKVVVIGECGFDFSRHSKASIYERQYKLLMDQANFAINHSKPLMIHARDTYDEIFEALEPLNHKYGKALRGNVHFFSGDISTAERFLGIGFNISFTGVITFARDYDEVIRHVSLDRIMAETDAPYVTPVPHRGKRNEPSYVQEVVKKIAEIRGEDLETVRQALTNNALKLFNI